MNSLLPDCISFTKMTAGGNDFVCIDNTTGLYDALLHSEALGDFIRAICRRGLSVGADGVIVACERGSGEGIDVVARFLEPDGSEARLCGNGTACFTYWALSKGLVAGPDVTILTAAGTAQARPDPDEPHRIRVCVPDPRDLQLDLPVPVGHKHWTVSVIDTGVPHAVIFVDDLEAVDVTKDGAAIRHHPKFQPLGGVNVNFVHIINEGDIAVRTFEFGVEAETLACGTGSTAAAIVTCIKAHWPERCRSGEKPVNVSVRGGETLRIWFSLEDNGLITDVCLETGARAIYDGKLRPELLRELRHMNGPPAATPKTGSTSTV